MSYEASMKCKFCAEEIQDSAILCRFCGATLEGPHWLPPLRNSSQKNATRNGAFTINSTAILLILGAVLELSSPLAKVPLFGDVRGGAVAFIYHFLSASFFALAGLGLLEGSKRGLKAFYAMIAFYTIQQLLFIFDSNATEAYLKQSGISAITGLLGAGGDSIAEAMRSASILMLLSTLGFAFYIYIRRDYFQ